MCCNDYISKYGVEGSIGEFESNSMNEKGSEKNITKGDEEVGSKQNKEDYNQGNACVNDDVMHGHGVRGKISNILQIRRFEWRGVKCDLVDNVGVFLAKDHVVACDPHEATLDDQLGEDHVGLCILYCPVTMSIMMTIWKWTLA
jgi:hypothetical protein